jgi:hypothetical protein
MIDKQELLARKPKVKKLDVELEGLGEVYVRSMSARHRDMLQYAMLKLPEKEQSLFNVPNITALSCVCTMCDAEGALLFAVEDAEALGDAFAYETLAAIAFEGLVLSEIFPSQLADAEKNSEAPAEPSAGSLGTSASNSATEATTSSSTP